MDKETATVRAIIYENQKIQVLDIETGTTDAKEAEARVRKAMCYKDLSGACSVGDVVLVNTTAANLSLGTGGYDFVIERFTASTASVTNVASSEVPRATEDERCDSSKGFLPQQFRGHIMKLRYTPMQTNVNCIEDPESPFHDSMEKSQNLDGLPVACCGLHSQFPLVAAGIRREMSDAKIVYVMTDQASLMLPFSKLATSAVDKGLVNLTITCGQAMGGNLEAVTLHSALQACKCVLDADAVIVSMGPGIVGTGTALGNGGVAQAEAVNAAAALGANPVAVARISFADKRERHYGVSHHFATAMGKLALAKATIFIPNTMDQDQMELVGKQLEESGIIRKHDVKMMVLARPNSLHIGIEECPQENPADISNASDAIEASQSETSWANDNQIDDDSIDPNAVYGNPDGNPIDTRGIEIKTMGRTFEQDPEFFWSAYCSGIGMAKMIASYRRQGGRAL